MTTKTFHIGDILSITDGHLVSPRHIEGVYDILNWMTGESLMTHQLPRASRECEDTLRRAFPDLAEIQVPDGLNSEGKVRTFLASLTSKYGTHRDVPRLDPLDHTHIDPIEELVLANPNATVIVVEAKETDHG